MNQLPFADDTTLVADLEEKIRQLLEEFGRVCERRKMKINESKSKVMKYNRLVDDRIIQ